MPFAFSIEKSTQAVAVLLREAPPPHRDNFMRLLKLLYLADRRCIQEAGAPITGDRVHAMPRGPVLSRTYDLMKGATSGFGQWSQYLERVGQYELQLIEDPGRDQLSPFEIEVLQQVWRDHLGHDEFEMVELTHQLPEWQRHKPHDGIKNERIPLQSILEAVGRADDAPILLARADEDAFLRRVLSSA